MPLSGMVNPMRPEKNPTPQTQNLNPDAASNAEITRENGLMIVTVSLPLGGLKGVRFDLAHRVLRLWSPASKGVMQRLILLPQAVRGGNYLVRERNGVVEFLFETEAPAA